MNSKPIAREIIKSIVSIVSADCTFEQFQVKSNSTRIEKKPIFMVHFITDKPLVHD